MRVVTSFQFIVETIILLLMPWPNTDGPVIMHTPNFNNGTNCYQQYTIYRDEIMLTLMFLRFYFLLDSCTQIAPMNHELFGKRILKDFKTEANLGF
jgi:hypothetical protein